jgi:hypothetical protein
MIPPIFTICAADTAVRALIGSNPVRLYPFGEAPQGVAKPYAVWQTINGSPENFLSGRPDADNYSVQVDVYGLTSESVLQVAGALRNALELDAHITNWGNTSRDYETKNYRYNVGVDFIQNR